MNTTNNIAEADELKDVVIHVCQPCLDGEPGECHYPGCIQFLRGEIKGQMGERLDFEYRYEYATAYTQRVALVGRIEEIEKALKGNLGPNAYISIGPLQQRLAALKAQLGRSEEGTGE